MHNRNQLNIHDNKHTSNLSNDFLQPAHELSQQKLNYRQSYFIMTTGMPIHNQITIRDTKHTSIAILNRYHHNAQLVVAIGTHKGHFFHRCINTNLFQRM
jgi:hypothetical protein